MSGRSPDQLARELESFIRARSVTIWNQQAMLAALAELQAQAEAGQRLQDDDAVLAGVIAVRLQYMLRVGGRAEHAQAFRDALAAAAPSPADQEAQCTALPESGGRSHRAGLARATERGAPEALPPDSDSAVPDGRPSA